MVEATACAAVLGGAPSTLYAAARSGRPEQAVHQGLDATTRIGVLLPPFRPGLVRGVTAHLLISAMAGAVLARWLPRRHSRAYGAAAGLAMGWCNLVLVGRRIPAIAELPLGPQLADNVAFGVAFAAVADRPFAEGRGGLI